MDARKTAMGAEQALSLARQVDHIYAAKGKNVVHFDMRHEKPEDETLLKVLLGPTGNLRAPTLRKGRTLLVGFERGMYEKVIR